MNLIITGAAGFIGSNFCCQFYKKFKKIIIIDCLNYSGLKRIYLMLISLIYIINIILTLLYILLHKLMLITHIII